MASYNELNALIDAYINRNGVQAITGQILNGVLKAMVEQLGRGYTIMGAAIPTTDPGTPDGPECYFASETGTYTDFGGLQVVPGELALLCYTPSDGWTKATIYEGFREVGATIDGNVGTPSVGVSYADGVLSFDFHNMKGNPGDAAGFGAVTATVDANVGTPGVSVQTSGPDTAKNITFAFRNLKGETGVTSCVVTVDNTTGTPSCAVSLVGQELHLDFSGLKGAQGNTGSSVDYPFTIVNNLTTDDATQALSAAMGVQLESEVSQLEAEIDGSVVEHFTRGGSINSGGTVTANDTYCYSGYIPVTGGLSYTVDYGTPADTQNEVFYNSGKSKIDYWPLYPSYGPLKTVTAPASSAYLRFSFLPSYNAKVYQGDTLIWQAQDITPGLEDRVGALEREVPGINADVQTLSGKIDSVKDDVSKIAVDKNTIDYGIKAGYEFSRISGTPLEDITVSETETGINIAKTGGKNLTFKIRLPQISKAGTYHIVFSSNKEMTSVNIYKNDTSDSSVQATDNVCEFDYVYDGTYVLAIGTSMFYDKSSQDYSLVATIPNATGMTVLADNISERVQVLEDSAQTPIPASVEGTNTFIGDGAGQNNTPIEGSDNGKYNTAVGKNAMLYNTLGDHCTALGFCAMNKNQDGRNNTALGEDALYENLHGGQNVAIGQHSGQDSQGGYNVFIGSNVARRMASGDLNVIIGAEAYNDYNQLGGSNMVLIGAYVRNSGNYDGVISIRGEEPTAAKQIRIGKADFSAFIIGNKKLNFNQDGTVTWEDVTPTP